MAKSYTRILGVEAPEPPRPTPEDDEAPGDNELAASELEGSLPLTSTEKEAV